MVTQIAVGWNDSDTSIYLSYNKIKDGINKDWDVETIMSGLQLGFAQLLKQNAEPAEVEAEPT